MKIIKKILILFAFAFSFVNANATAPTWSVNAVDFKYSMLYVGVVYLDFTKMADENSMIGAFVGNECRGVATPVYDDKTGNYTFYLTVYSNVDNQMITFKYYNSTSDEITTFDKTDTFTADGVSGSPFAPKIWTDQILSSDADILSYSIPGQDGGTVINGTDISVVMPFGTDLTALTADFTSSDHALVQVGGLTQTSGVTVNNFFFPVLYDIRSVDETTTQSYTVTVSLANAVPTDIYLSKTDVLETAAVGTLIGNLTSEDGNTNDTHTYSLVAGAGDTDNGSFNISGTELQLNTAFDFETKTSYSIRLQTDDNRGGLFEKQFTINVIDVNDEIPQVSGAQINLSENTPLQTIYTITATDADVSTAFKTLTYSITGGNDANKFSINSSNGVVSLVSALDFETVNSYELQITASDGINSGNGILSITVTDENDETSVVTAGNVQLLENKLPGEQVGQVQASDADANSVLQYSITNGNTASAFSINQNTGVILLASSVDFEKLKSYNLEISVFDGVNTGIGTFTINIVDVNDEIPLVTSTEVNIPETTSVGTAVDTVQATDADANSVFEYSIVSGNTDNRFGINANTGVLRILKPLDYENITTYHIEVAVFDGINTGTGTITISVTDENDEIPVVTDETVNVSETELAGYKVTDVIAQDADANTVFSYYIESGNAENKFLLDQITGELTLNESLDYELTNSYTLAIRVNDGIHSSYGTINIDVVALNDEPPVVDAANVSIPEDAIFGEIVHTVSASDPDGGTILTYSITAGNTKSAFEIDPDHGILTVLGALNYETIPEYNLEVTVDDGIHQASNTIHIAIEDVNDNVPVVKDTTVNVAENKEQGSVIYTIDAFDADQNSVLSYQIVSGNAEEGFSVNSADGDIILSKSLDFETQNAYTISVLVSDGLHSNSGIITFNVEDINDEFPVFNDTIFTVSEIADTGTLIGYLEASDADANSVLTFSLMDNNQTDFDLSETGELSLATLLDYANQSEYSFQVEVSDGLNKSYGKLTIQVIEFDKSKFEAYNIFSPNGDGINDYWKIKNKEVYRNYTFYIYTNTGQEVYKSEGYNNDWDGKFKGKDLPVGVYYYYVTSPDCNTCRFTGTISLIK